MKKFTRYELDNGDVLNVGPDGSVDYWQGNYHCLAIKNPEKLHEALGDALSKDAEHFSEDEAIGKLRDELVDYLGKYRGATPLQLRDAFDMIIRRWW